MADYKCQEDEGEAYAGTDTNEVGIYVSKMKLVSFVPNPGKDQHNQDQEQLQDPEDALEGAKVVALAPNGPGQVPDKGAVHSGL